MTLRNNDNRSHDSCYRITGRRNEDLQRRKNSCKYLLKKLSMSSQGKKFSLLLSANSVVSYIYFFLFQEKKKLLLKKRIIY